MNLTKCVCGHAQKCHSIGYGGDHGAGKCHHCACIHYCAKEK